MPPSGLLPFDESSAGGVTVELGPRAAVLRGFVRPQAGELIEVIREIAAISPFRHMITPGGWTMSVALTNCGEVGWVSDKSGYRYDPIDPATGRRWPPMPGVFRELAQAASAAAGFEGFEPDAVLVNRYAPGARLSLHQDRNERDFDQPIVSVSLGLPAIFLWAGLTRKDRPQRVPLESGDVVVWGGPDRLRFHGIDTLPQGEHPLTGGVRFNLTFRRAR